MSLPQPSYSTVQFTLFNNETFSWDLRLFDTTIQSNFETSNQLAGVTRWIEGSANYNEFVRDNLSNPKIIDRIKILSQSNTITQKTLRIVRRDANGTECQYSVLPVANVDPKQYIGQIISVDFDKLILDANCYIPYLLEGVSRVTFVLFYRTIERVSLLKQLPVSPNDIFEVTVGNDAYTKFWLDQSRVGPKWDELS